MRSLAIIAAVLALTTGCSMLGPSKAEAPVAEADPWVGFNNGYEKKAEAKSEPAKPVKTDKGEDEKKAQKADDEKVEKATAALSEDKSDDEASGKPAKKKPAARKGKKKAAGAAVAAKKPRKRAKKPG